MSKSLCICLSHLLNRSILAPSLFTRGFYNYSPNCIPLREVADWPAHHDLDATFRKIGKRSAYCLLPDKHPGKEDQGFPVFLGFPSGSDGKESANNAGDLALIPGLGRSSGEEHGNPLQYSCLENPHDRGAWRATVMGCKESDTTD